MNANDYKNTFKNKNVLQLQVFNILEDCLWNCRSCMGKKINTRQIAGGGGIGGLKRGTKNRPGLVIKTKLEFCQYCNTKTEWDRWTGEFQSSNAASSIPIKLQNKILAYYNYTDSIENRKCSRHELIIDHRFPMERWGIFEESNSHHMTENEIRRKFQLLKKDSSGNHNLLKSRACEKCLSTGKRGYPMGIKFWYEGDENWPNNIPTIGLEAEHGCVGCGWYNYKTWRIEVNKYLNKK